MAAAPDVTFPENICSSPGDPRVDAFNAEFFGFFQMIPKFRIKEQRLGW